MQMTLASSQCPPVCPACAPVYTLPQVALAAHTLHVVQRPSQNLPQVSPRGGRHSLATLQLAAPRWQPRPGPRGCHTTVPHASGRPELPRSLNISLDPPTSLTATQGPGENGGHLGSALCLWKAPFILFNLQVVIPILQPGKITQSSASQTARARIIFNFKSPQEDFIPLFQQVKLSLETA